MDRVELVCLSCDNVNPGDMRFCGYCGAALPLLCAACGRSVPTGMKFCGYCGTALPSSAPPADVSSAGIPPTPERSLPVSGITPAATDSRSASLGIPTEERRLVTALFCDLVGFTPLSEALDPEDVRDLQAEYFSAMAGQIQRYGGTIEKYAGDAVLALFGAPVAHEDDAERAVLCALGMQESIDPVAERARAQWQAEPQIRVGVNTGEVVSGTWSASARQDVAVTGDAVNSAARIQATADPGEVLVGAETMRLTRRRIRYGERREVTLKGKVSQVPVWPALGIREEFGERWEGYETPLVGRDREMVQFLDAWVRAQAGEGQVITVVGDAGVGKSRLIAEFLGTIAASSAVRVIRARSLSYGQEISLWLVADLLRSIFGIREQETPAEVATKLQGALSPLLAEIDFRADALDVLGEVLGLPIGESAVTRAGPQIRRHALVRSIRAVLGAIAERAATVLVLEDMHWMDNASREVLTEVLADVLGLRMLVLAAQRPGWIAPWSEWGWPERITLRPLGEGDSATLARAVLGGASPAPDLERHVAERAGGNPFFVEEMLRALQETGGIVEHDGQMHLVPGAAGKLPSTLTEVLLARLDRLEVETKGVAQVASVIGRSFAVPLLAEVVGQTAESLETPLGQLQRAEVAFPRRTPVLEYVFKHVSLRDVAYNTLIHKRRQELHLQTARAIATLYPTDEYTEMIAYHYAKTDAPEAAEWLEKAGLRAAAIYANEEAIGHFLEALRRFGQQGADEGIVARLEEHLGTALQTAGRYEEALEHLGQAAALARQHRDLEGAGRVVALMGMVNRLRSTPQEGIALVSPMIDLLAWSGPSESLASLYLSLASLFFVVGSYREMYTSAEKAAEIARAIGSQRLLGDAQERLGVSLVLLGQPEESRRTIEEAIPLIEAGGDLMTLSRALVNMGEAAKVAGDIEAARRHTERAIETDERVGNPDRLAFDLSNLGDILRILGNWEAAQGVLERAQALAGDPRRGMATQTTFVSVANLALDAGDWEEAERLLTETLGLVQQSVNRQVHEIAETLLAELDLLHGRPREAIARIGPFVDAEDANLGSLLPVLAWAQYEAGDIELAGETAARAIERTRNYEPLNLVAALRVQGIVLVGQGQIEAGAAALEEGLERARSLPYPYAEARILEALGRWQEAHEIFCRLGARKDAERTGDLLHSPE